MMFALASGTELDLPRLLTFSTGLGAFFIATTGGLESQKIRQMQQITIGHTVLPV
jgi:hypothetical protein